MSKVVLLVEDDDDVQFFNKSLLEENGFTVDSAVTLAAAREAVIRRAPDVLVLDIGMPDGSGLDFLREFRRGSKSPVLMLTGYSADDDVVKGFKYGCNDYLTKPYTFEVLIARLKSLLQSVEQISENITKGSITLKIMSGEAYVNGMNLLLTRKEYSLMFYFVQNENRVISAEHIYEKVWGQPMAGDANAVKTAVSKLRKKLRNSGYTITVERGEGYCFELA
jgi:DNA-binding response OmpR family regulator